jgi:hypothetical protein
MKGFHIDEGWIMIILLSCLGLALTFVDFGLGLVNLAGAQETRLAQPAPPVPPPPEPVPDGARLEQARQLQSELDRWRREAGQRRQEAESRQQARDQARAGLADARSRLAASQAQARGLEGAVAGRRSEQAAQQTQRQRGEQEQAAAASQLAGLRRQLEQAEQRARELQRQVRDIDLVDPGQLCGGRCSGKQPQFVECHGQGVTLQPQGETVTLAQLRTNQNQLRRALGAQRYVMFLIRPSGIAAFKAARPIVEGKGFEFGFEPVDEKWRFKYQVRGARL